ncbi:phage portal protein, partial [Staphylococcus xylosus]|uniref:phage portal protein n=1 Tax=Staphylococcus xylosus TaxID=1288 RepID=UPI0020A65732
MSELKKKFSPKANADLLAEDAAAVVSDYTKLQNLVKRHKIEQAPRLEMLEQYFLSDNTGILTGERRKDKDKADHRAVHNFAKYISQFIVGYLTGNPLTFSHDDKDTQQAI